MSIEKDSNDYFVPWVKSLHNTLLCPFFLWWEFKYYEDHNLLGREIILRLEKENEQLKSELKQMKDKIHDFSKAVLEVHENFHK